MSIRLTRTHVLLHIATCFGLRMSGDRLEVSRLYPTQTTVTVAMPLASSESLR